MVYIWCNWIASTLFQTNLAKNSHLICWRPQISLQWKVGQSIPRKSQIARYHFKFTPNEFREGIELAIVKKSFALFFRRIKSLQQACLLFFSLYIFFFNYIFCHFVLTRDVIAIWRRLLMASYQNRMLMRKIVDWIKHFHRDH